MTMYRFAQFFVGSVALVWVFELVFEKVMKVRSRCTDASDAVGANVSPSNDPP